MGNSSNAYMTEKPIGVSMAGLAKDVNDAGFAYRQEKRLNDEIARRAKEAEDKKKADLETKYSEMKSMNPTGIKSVDEAMITYINQAQDKRLEFYKKELKGEKLSPEEVVLNKRLQNLPDTLSMMVKNYDDQNKQYVDEVKKGNIHRDSDYEAKMQKMSNGAIPFLDNDFNPAIGFDRDGDGKPEVVSYDLNQGFSLKPQFVPNVNEDTVLKTFTGTLEPEVNQTDKNFVKTKTTGISPEIARQGARQLVYDGNELSPLAKSYFWKAGVRDFSQIKPEQVDAYQKELETRILASVKRGKETDVDYGAMTSAATEARQAKKDQEDKPMMGEPVEPSKERWGNQFSNIGKGYRSIPVTGNLVLNNIQVGQMQSNIKDGKTISTQKTNFRNLSNAQVEDYTFDKNGNLLLNVSYETAKTKDKTTTKVPLDKNATTTGVDYADDSTTQKEKSNEQIKASRETAAKVAAKLGMTLDEMRQKANGGKTETAAERAARIANGG